MTNFSRRPFFFILSLWAVVPSLLQAHTGVHGGVDFSHGVQHPLGGLDHMLAMVAVGLWAAQLGGRAVWMVPLSFVLVMALGGLAGIAGFNLPYVEQGILSSTFILGLLIAAAVRLPLIASVLVVGGFALFHGYAHGAEMPAHSSAWAYGGGFILSTLALHLLGIGGGLLMQKMAQARLVRLTGAAIAAAGLVLFLV